jgi:hypothetical protein
VGDRLEHRFGRLAREYAKIVFDKMRLEIDPTLEWVTPGHPLFEVIRDETVERLADHRRRGAVFFDLHRQEPSLLDVFAASIKDGRGHTLHRRLFILETLQSGEMLVRQPTLLHDVTASPTKTPPPAWGATVPDRRLVEEALFERALRPWLEEVATERADEINRVSPHVEISLNALIDRQQVQLGEYLTRQLEGDPVPGLDGLIALAEQHLDELNTRLDSRRRELELERHCTIADIGHLGRAWVVPHPEREKPSLARMVRDEAIEHLAVQIAIEYEERRGWSVESVEQENRGFDLISRRAHPEDPKTFVEVRFIEVKGRAGVGEIALTTNEFRAAERLKADYWLYAIFNCGSTPETLTVQNPARLGWKPIVTVEHYAVPPEAIRRAAGEGE